MSAPRRRASARTSISTNTQIGLVFSAFAYPYLVFQIIGGWVSDRFGTRRTLIVCGLIWAIGHGPDRAWRAGLSRCWRRGCCWAWAKAPPFPPPPPPWRAGCRQGQRGFAQGITHAAARIGNALAPGVIVAIMAAYGWRASFFVCAAISFVWVVAVDAHLHAKTRGPSPHHAGRTWRRCRRHRPKASARALGPAVQAHGARHHRLFLLWLDPVAVPELDPAIFPAQLRI